MTLRTPLETPLETPLDTPLETPPSTLTSLSSHLNNVRGPPVAEGDRDAARRHPLDDRDAKVLEGGRISLGIHLGPGQVPLSQKVGCGEGQVPLSQKVGCGEGQVTLSNGVQISGDLTEATVGNRQSPATQYCHTRMKSMAGIL